MKIGIDTNIFINLFESSEDLAKLRDVGFKKVEYHEKSSGIRALKL